MKRFLLCSTLLLPLPAMAADLTVKAPMVPARAPCSQTLCTGFYGGVDLLESGGSFNIVSTGINGLAQNNFAIGGHAGWEFFNGKWFFAAEAGGDYGLAQKGTLPGGGNQGLWNAYGLAKIGYSLLPAFGIAVPADGTAPSLPGTFAIMAPYVVLGIWDRPWGAGFASGAGVQAWLAPKITLSSEFIHVDYNNANVNPIVTQQTENMIRATIDYHF